MAFKASRLKLILIYSLNRNAKIKYANFKIVNTYVNLDTLNLHGNDTPHTQLHFYTQK